MDSGEGQLLLINKPLHWTSFDVVNKLRSILKIKKIGHAGTLDPLATGLLIICTGKMTRSIETYQGMEKEYTGKMVLGQMTPSYDLETQPTEPADISGLTEDKIYRVAGTFIGKISQVPPAHSSVRVGGKRSYELARKGKAVTLEPREVEIREFEITHVRLPEVKFRVVCSKGTYIRSLAHDLGQALGTGAYLSELCRTRIGKFSIQDSHTIEEFARSVSGKTGPSN